MVAVDKTSSNKAEGADPMDVVAISTGTTPSTWDLAQMHPPTAQQPAMDPFYEEKPNPEDLDAGALWPRNPTGPKDPDGEVAPFSTAIGTHGQVEDGPETESKVASPETPDSGHEGDVPAATETAPTGTRAPRSR